jgi:hypothetical protein
LFALLCVLAAEVFPNADNHKKQRAYYPKYGCCHYLTGADLLIAALNAAIKAITHSAFANPTKAAIEKSPAEIKLTAPANPANAAKM